MFIANVTYIENFSSARFIAATADLSALAGYQMNLLHPIIDHLNNAESVTSVI